MPGGGTALGAIGCLPLRNDGSLTRPTCQIWAKMHPPASCTAAVIGFHKLGLLRGPDTRDLSVADAHGRDRSAFRDDHAGGGALAVVLGHDGGRQVADGAAQAGQRCHYDSVSQVQRAHAQRFQQLTHDILQAHSA